MTTRNLDPLLHPRSVALVGASERPGTLEAVVLRNVVDGGFAGPVWPVNPAHETLAGLPCFARVTDLPGVPDLAVVTTPAAGVPGLIAELAAQGCKAVVVVSGGIDGALRQAMLDAARPHLVRIVGPDTLGVVVPHARLNASAAQASPAPGQIALLSQSAAIVTTLIDWAAEHGIGFSQIVSLGDMADVDVADCLDLLAGDGRTRAVLLYLESIPNARKFLSAARALARLKPVIAIKAGRTAQGALAAATHSGALSGSDEVARAALRRAGVLRVRGLTEMLAAAETVARFRPLDRARLGIVTNGGGAAVLAVDRLADVGGELATLALATLARLEAALPAGWSRRNPVDIGAEASPQNHVAALEALAADAEVDAVLVINCPTALASQVEAARALAGRVERGMIGGKPVLSCWLGGPVAREARALLRAAGVASYGSPAEAAAALGHLTDWGRAQAALLRVPDRGAEEALLGLPARAFEAAGEILVRVAAEGRRVLTEPEAKAVIAAYGIPVPDTRFVATPAEVGAVAAAMLEDHPRIVVKMLSRGAIHKSEVGGVVLDVETAAEASRAAEGIAGRAAGVVRLDGFTVQPMVRRPGGLELILGVARDPAFGPVILFGAGGTAVEVLGDTAIGLPPLDAGLADDLVSATRIGRLLAGYRDHAPADMGAIRGALIALSHLIEDFPCLRGLDINPLLADANGAVALDARIEIDPGDARPPPNPDLAIRPYPAAWRRVVDLKDGAYAIRPVRPADALLYDAFLGRLDKEAIRMRFLAPRRHFPAEMAMRLTRLDYDREMAFVALAPDGSLAGVSRIACAPDHRSAEYALIVRSDLEGRGIGSALMRQLIAYAKADGIERLDGMILADNTPMLDLVRRLGFCIETVPEEPGVVMSRLEL